MKILETHFNEYLNRVWPFSTAFNSHHRNILKKICVNEWHQLIPLYEAQKQTGYLRDFHRIQIQVGDELITIPKKLSDQIHSYVSVYFSRSIPKPKCLANHCGMTFNSWA